MNENNDRMMSLFKYTAYGDVRFVDDIEYLYENEHKERILSEKLCRDTGFYNDEGFIIIGDITGKKLYQMPLLKKERHR